MGLLRDESEEQTGTDTQWAVDRSLIVELTARYNHCFDSGDAEGFAATFVDDGVVEVEGGLTISGHDALVAMCRRTPVGTMHVTTDAEVAVQGDRATQHCTIMVLGRPGGKTRSGEERAIPTIERTGYYHDELARTEDGWRFVRRHVVLDGGA